MQSHAASIWLRPSPQAVIWASYVAMTPCMPCTFSALQSPRSGAVVQLNDSSALTVADRYVPLVTAACGT
jgi:hypothetical protein